MTGPVPKWESGAMRAITTWLDVLTERGILGGGCYWHQGGDMKKRLVIVTIMFLAALILSPGGGTVRASGHETLYTIYYTCTCSPCPTGEVVGEWNVDCDGN